MLLRTNGKWKAFRVRTQRWLAHFLARKIQRLCKLLVLWQTHCEFFLSIYYRHRYYLALEMKIVNTCAWKLRASVKRHVQCSCWKILLLSVKLYECADLRQNAKKISSKICEWQRKHPHIQLNRIEGGNCVSVMHVACVRLLRAIPITKYLFLI